MEFSWKWGVPKQALKWEVVPDQPAEAEKPRLIMEFFICFIHRLIILLQKLGSLVNRTPCSSRYAAHQKRLMVENVSFSMQNCSTGHDR